MRKSTGSIVSKLISIWFCKKLLREIHFSRTKDIYFQLCTKQYSEICIDFYVLTWQEKYIFKYGSSLVWCSMLSKFMILHFIFILQKCTFCYWRKKPLHFLQLIFHVVWAASSAVMQYGNWHLRSIHNCLKKIWISFWHFYPRLPYFVSFVH